MSPEQNHGKPLGYPHGISDVAEATKIPKDRMGQLRMRIDNIKPPIFPVTDLRGRVWLSEEDFLRVVQSVKGEKDKPTNTDTKIEPKPSHTKRAEKIKPQIEPIALPNGKIISAKKDSKTRTVIREVLRSQKEGKPYPAKQISLKRDLYYLGYTANWIQYVVTTANRILRPYNYELTLYEAEIDGKNTRACRIIEKKPVPTSSPEPGC